MSDSVYVEHYSLHVPTKVRRFATLDEAVEGIRKAVRLDDPTEIRADLCRGGIYWWGSSDSWRIVVAEEFHRRAEYYRLMGVRMDADEDVSDIQE